MGKKGKMGKNGEKNIANFSLGSLGERVGDPSQLIQRYCRSSSIR
jgi:hypothetical protein